MKQKTRRIFVFWTSLEGFNNPAANSDIGVRDWNLQQETYLFVFRKRALMRSQINVKLSVNEFAWLTGPRTI